MTSMATNMEATTKPNVIPPLAANANAPASSFSNEEPLRSKYKGVYRCGKRWKAQFQHQGVQFYLGMFDTEEEASEAYQNKARRYQSGNKADEAPTNYQNLVHNGNPLLVGSRSMSNLAQYHEMDNSNAREDQPHVKRQRIYSSAMQQHQIPHNHTFSHSSLGQSQGDVLSSLQARLMWERLTAIYQRLLLAKAVAEKMSQLQVSSNDSAPSQERDSLLKSLGEEIVMLGVVKGQLEEAVSQYFLREISLQSTEILSSPQFQVGNNDKSFFHDPSVSNHMMLDLPLDPAEIAVLPLTHLTTPLHPQPVLSSSQENLTAKKADIQSSQKEDELLPKVTEISGLSSNNLHGMLVTDQHNESASNHSGSNYSMSAELTRGDSLLYDVPALPSSTEKSRIPEGMLSEISVLTNVNSLQQSHSLQFGFSSLDTNNLNVQDFDHGIEVLNAKSSMDNGISDTEQMQKLQQLIHMQNSSMKKLND